MNKSSLLFLLPERKESDEASLPRIASQHPVSKTLTFRLELIGQLDLWDRDIIDIIDTINVRDDNHHALPSNQLYLRGLKPLPTPKRPSSDARGIIGPPGGERAISGGEVHAQGSI
jgi:hypothetical protein